MGAGRLAVLLMLAQSVLFAIENSLIHYVGSGADVMQIILLRGLGGLALVVALAAVNGAGGAVVHSKHIGVQLLRGALVAGYAWVLTYSLTKLPLANAIAISFTTVAYTVLFAKVILDEQITGWRLAGAVFSIIGALLITKPTFGESDIDHAIVLLGTSLNGLLFVLNRYVQRQAGDTQLATMFYANAFLVVAYLPAFALAAPPAPATWPSLFGLVVFGSVGMYLGIVAVRYASAAALAPLTLTRLVLTTLAGVFLFNEKPDPLTLAGILLILFSCWMAMRPAPTETQGRQAAD